ncbi:MAG TPA: tautomerase family protein [Propionibacteriaceae bacterium]|nr:tautomerase family protein [Propionibacteriaceae bacterium]
MPLVRIDVQEGRTPEELRKLADTIQDVMLDVFAAPPGDRYQIITEHDRGHIIAEDTGLGLERTDGIVIIQIFQQGRSTEQKVAAYAELAKRLEAECGVRPEDLIISVMANRHVDWSFGLGQAQFLDGTLTSLDRPDPLSGQSVGTISEEQYGAESSRNAARS